MTQAATAGAELVAGYRPPVAGYDEMVDRAGTVRPHWAHVGQVLDGLGVDELGRRRAEAARLLDDDGVTYNIYGAARPTSRWSLDPVPVLLTSAEWAGKEGVQCYLFEASSETESRSPSVPERAQMFRSPSQGRTANSAPTAGL